MPVVTVVTTNYLVLLYIYSSDAARPTRQNNQGPRRLSICQQIYPTVQLQLSMPWPNNPQRATRGNAGGRTRRGRAGPPTQEPRPDHHVPVAPPLSLSRTNSDNPVAANRLEPHKHHNQARPRYLHRTVDYVRQLCAGAGHAGDE